MPDRYRPNRTLMLRWLAVLGLALSLTSTLTSYAAAQVRIKDISSFEGVRENHLIGYGLVVGLPGTGDKLSNSPFTRESIAGMLERLGVGNIESDLLKTKNAAAVMVTAKLPPFARLGAPIDVIVSSLGDASSLRGGTLLVTPLSGADGEIYAVAQGPIAVAGFMVQGNASSVTEGVPTIAKIENGAIIEREVSFELNSLDSFRIALRVPDFTTAVRVRDAINTHYNTQTAMVLDPGTVEVRPPRGHRITDLAFEIENLRVTPDATARVVVDEKSGTIVIGSNVRIGQVAISQGGLTIRVRENFNVSQPTPISIGGSTVVVPDTEIEIKEAETQFTVLEGDISLQDLVDGLNAIGVGARQTISILQAIKAAGALHADLEII